MTVHKRPTGRARDRRYGLARWQRVRARVLRRDGYACQVVKGCPTRATVADHIQPATPDMPDVLFFSPANLRASCRQHNIARGFAAQLDGTDAPPSAILTGDLS